MNASITTLKEPDGTGILYPKTRTDAVYDGSGNRLDQTISDIDSDISSLQSDLGSKSSASAVTGNDAFSKISTLNSDLATLTSNKKIKIVAGTIRRNSDGWYFINDADHEPINVSSVTESNGFVTINFNFTASKVISFVVVPDDTFANKYDVGVSCGTSSAVLSFYNKKNYIADYIYYDTSTNSFKTTTGDIISTSLNNYKLTLNHRNIDGGDNCGVTVVGRGCTAICEGTASNSIDIAFIRPDGNYVTSFTSSYRAYVSRPLPYGQSVYSNILTDSNGNFWFLGLMEVS